MKSNKMKIFQFQNDNKTSPKNSNRSDKKQKQFYQIDLNSNMISK